MEWGWSHADLWWLTIRRDISAVQIPLEEQAVPATHWALQLSVTVLGREVSIASDYENQQRSLLSEKKSVAGVTDISLKGTTHELTCSELQHWDRKWKGVRTHKKELSWFVCLQGEGWSGSFIQDRSASRIYFFFFETSCLLMCRHRWPPLLSFHQPGYPALLITWDPALFKLQAHPSLFQWFLHIKDMFGLCSKHS